MTGENGYDLIKEIRALPPEKGGNIPAVALTAYAGSLDRRRALIAGFHVHLAKPVEPDELLAVIGSLGRTLATTDHNIPESNLEAVSTTCGSGWVNHPDSNSTAKSHASSTHPLPQVVLTASKFDLRLGSLTC
jgi:DNA-binding response OmpR family regulator